MKPILKSIKAFLFVIIIFVLTPFQSCEKIEALIETENQIIDKKEAIKIAEKLLYLDHSIPPSSNEVELKHYTILKKVKNVKTLINEKGMNVLYVINYIDGGFVLISGDKRMPLVLAHGAYGEFTIDDDQLDNTGLAYWLSDMMDEYDLATSDNYPEEFQAEIDSLTKEFERNPNPIPVHISCANGRVVFDTLERFPVWGQGVGYNNLLTDTCFADADMGFRPPVGCGNTATAQIMKSLFDYRKYNGVYNYKGEIWSPRWQIMPLLNESGLIAGTMYEIQQVMQNIGELQGSTYQCDGTGNKRSNRLIFFRDSLKMKNAKLANLNSQILRTNLSNNLPVQIAGRNLTREMITYIDEDGTIVKKPTGKMLANGNHAFVVKGFKTLLGCSSKNYLRYLYYMDWGWDGFCNGWFWLGTENTFNTNRQMIYDLGQ
jgi:hypothetical protein